MIGSWGVRAAGRAWQLGTHLPPDRVVGPFEQRTGPVRAQIVLERGDPGGGRDRGWTRTVCGRRERGDGPSTRGRRTQAHGRDGHVGRLPAANSWRANTACRATVAPNGLAPLAIPCRYSRVGRGRWTLGGAGARVPLCPSPGLGCSPRTACNPSPVPPICCMQPPAGVRSPGELMAPGREIEFLTSHSD